MTIVILQKSITFTFNEMATKERISDFYPDDDDEDDDESSRSSEDDNDADYVAVEQSN